MLPWFCRFDIIHPPICSSFSNPTYPHSPPYKPLFPPILLHIECLLLPFWQPHSCYVSVQTILHFSFHAKIYVQKRRIQQHSNLSEPQKLITTKQILFPSVSPTIVKFLPYRPEFDNIRHISIKENSENWLISSYVLEKFYPEKKRLLKACCSSWKSTRMFGCYHRNSCKIL